MRKISRKTFDIVLDGLLSALCVIVFFGTWPLYSGMLLDSSLALTVILAILAGLPLASFFALMFFTKAKRFTLVCRLHILFAIAVFIEHAVFLAYMMSKLYYLIIEGGPFVLLAAEAAILVALIFLDRFKRKAAKWIIVGILGVSFLFADIAWAFDIRAMYLNSGAVVFAVEDEYQIAFSSSAESIGSVTIGERTFYDSCGGVKNVSTLHKISVPRELLDREKRYTISCAAMIRSRAYLSTAGRTVTRSFNFRPADKEDGLNVFNFSDNHMLNTGVVRASRYFGDKLDLIIANGDIINDVSDEYQLTLMYRTLARVSSSSVPIIISRGNHESAGRIVSALPDYIGSREGKIFYTARFNDTLFVVLDVANDVTDDDRTIRPTANFDEYRAQELDWLGGLKGRAELEAEGIRHVIAVCHIPYPLYMSKIHTEFIGELIEETHRIGVEFLICGHRHMTYMTEAGEEGNPAGYPYIVGGKRSDSLDVNETVFASQYTGTAICVDGDRISAKFVNSKGEILEEFEL